MTVMINLYYPKYNHKHLLLYIHKSNVAKFIVFKEKKSQKPFKYLDTMKS